MMGGMKRLVKGRMKEDICEVRWCKAKFCRAGGRRRRRRKEPGFELGG